MRWADGTPDLTMHRWIYLTDKDPFRRYTHMKAGCKLLWPEVMKNGQKGYLWHKWTEERAKAWCGVCTPDSLEDVRICWIGAGGVGKTEDAALFLLWDWLCDPLHTSVRVATNTRECLKDRTWRSITRLWQLHPENTFPGYLVPSDQEIRARDQEGKDAPEGYIRGIAVKQGTIEQAIGSIKGAHSKRVRVVLDELDQMPIGVIEAIENVSSACESAITVGMGNPRKRYGNALGLLAEPESGRWSDCSVNMERWKTKHGICQFFDGRKSPAITEPEKYGSFLKTAKQIERTRKTGGENSPIFWEQCIGFFAPEGLSNSIIDEPLIVQYGLTENPVIMGSSIRGMTIDPAVSAGGDRCMVQPFTVTPVAVIMPRENGEDLNMPPRQVVVNALCYEPQIQIKIELREDKTVMDGIAEEVMKLAISKRIPVKYIGIDITGTQGAIADYLEAKFGQRGIYRICYSSAAGRAKLDHIIDEAHGKGYRGFVNKRAEMYYAFRVFARSRQIRGLNGDATNELTLTEWDKASPPIQVQDKKEVKAAVGQSPDAADTAVMALDLARYRMGLSPVGEDATLGLQEQQKVAQYSRDMYENPFSEDWQPMEA